MGRLSTKHMGATPDLDLDCERKTWRGPSKTSCSGRPYDACLFQAPVTVNTELLSNHELACHSWRLTLSGCHLGPDAARSWGSAGSCPSCCPGRCAPLAPGESLLQSDLLSRFRSSCKLRPFWPGRNGELT